MKTLKSLLLALCMIPAGLNAQEYMTPFNHNLLNGHHYDLIVGESSGDIAYHHILDMAPYERDRRSGEYSGLFMESSYVTDKLNEYGLEGVEVELLGKTRTWDGISASLWETSPNTARIADYRELAAILAQGSRSTHVTAELVWVGNGTKKGNRVRRPQGQDCRDRCSRRTST